MISDKKNIPAPPDFSEREDSDGNIIAVTCPAIIRHIQSMAWLDDVNGFKREQNWWDYLMDNGVARNGMPLPDGEEFMERQQCYCNAFQWIADNDPWGEEYHYVEGMAWRGLLTVQHAWVEDGAGNILDFTWRPEDGSTKDPTEWEYLGVSFQFSYVAELATKHDYMGVLDKPETYA